MVRAWILPARVPWKGSGSAERGVPNNVGVVQSPERQSESRHPIQLVTNRRRRATQRSPDPLFLGPFPPPVGQQGDHRLRLNWWVLYLLHFSLSVVLRVSIADAAKFRTPFLSRVDTMTSILTRAPVRACLRTAAPVASASISTCAAASIASTRLALELQRQRRCRLPATRGMASSTTAESQQKVAHSHQDRAQDTGS